MMLWCRACGLEKPATEFTTQAGSRTGYQVRCNLCRSAARRQEYACSPRVIAERAEREEKRLKNIKDWARRRVLTALGQGILVRPDTCSRCGCGNKPTKDGRPYIQAHHHRGYENELDVVWLCASCHVLEDRQNVGADNPNAKLDPASVQEVRQSTESSRAAAERLGVHTTTVQRIRSGEKWAHLE